MNTYKQRSNAQVCGAQVTSEGPSSKVSAVSPPPQYQQIKLALTRAALSTCGRAKSNFLSLTCLTDGENTPSITSVRLERLSGFASPAVLSEITTIDADTNATVVTTYIDRANKTITEVTHITQSSLIDN